MATEGDPQRTAAPPAEVEVWLVEPARVDDALVQAWLDQLDPDESARHARLRQPEDRRAFVAAHGLARAALSRRRPEIPPGGWRFAVSERGKPAVPGGHPHFNLSHSRPLVAVAIADDAELGVDVEPVNAGLAGDDVARRVYGPSELSDLHAQPDAASRVERFFERWVLKEAWVKATGAGIDDELPRFELALADGHARILRGDERPWRLQWWTPRPGVKLGLCVDAARPVSVTVRWWPA